MKKNYQKLLIHKQFIILSLLSIYVVISCFNPTSFNIAKMSIYVIIVVFCCFVIWADYPNINFKKRSNQIGIMFFVFLIIYFLYINFVQKKRIEEINTNFLKKINDFVQSGCPFSGTLISI
jgi:hypothetical protein